MTIKFEEVRDIFRSGGLKDPLLETRRLFEIVSGEMPGDGKTAFALPDINLSQVAQKRKAGVPLEYILGRVCFGELRLHCTSDTIIPTEYTTLLVDVALGFIEKRQRLERDQVIVEVGTGCGNIAVLLAKRTRDVTIIASDVSPEALKVARKNVEKYKVENAVSLVCGDLFGPFYDLGYQGKIDLILCNPPYIPTRSLDRLPAEISGHQPRIALDGGPYGISFFQRLLFEARPMLKSGGMLIFEIGVGQEKLITWLLNRDDGYDNIVCHKDSAGTIRVVSIRKVSLISDGLSAWEETRSESSDRR